MKLVRLLLVIAAVTITTVAMTNKFRMQPTALKAAEIIRPRRQALSRHRQPFYLSDSFSREFDDDEVVRFCSEETGIRRIKKPEDVFCHSEERMYDEKRDGCMYSCVLQLEHVLGDFAFNRTGILNRLAKSHASVFSREAVSNYLTECWLNNEKNRDPCSRDFYLSYCLYRHSDKMGMDGASKYCRPIY